ncbi:mediator of RNA polymerase II transcription subunit 20a-like [Vicia villosa]|uniref:mediator of RNA polymerase II transcription subunit 20a-like n=1 Tax=Vicia villosa TaxID=3911 RepID=UPI00273CEE91|nr:mediator of RNA polymerase II transcription subunit 20a-like [Vicia villosa]
MTVKRILYWKPNLESAINSHSVNKISECVKAFNGVKERTWKTELSLLFFFLSFCSYNISLFLFNSCWDDDGAGVQYKLGDLRFKLIKVLSRDKNRSGIFVEIEYMPISSIEIAKPIMEEFIEIWQQVVSTKSLSGEFIGTEPNFAEYGLSDSYTWRHTAVQYVDALLELIHSGGI